MKKLPASPFTTILLVLLIVGCGTKEEVAENSSSNATSSESTESAELETVKGEDGGLDTTARADNKPADTNDKTRESETPIGTLRSGTVVLDALIDPSGDGIEKLMSMFSFEKGQLTSASWMKEFFEEVEAAKTQGGQAIEDAIMANETLKAEVIDQYDIFLDAGHGLVGNCKMRGWEFGVGQGGFMDMGKVALEDVNEAPKFDGETYSSALKIAADAPPALAKFPALAENHSYVVRTAKGNFAKLHINKLNIPDNPERGYRLDSIEFDWVLQTDGSRSFE